MAELGLHYGVCHFRVHTFNHYPISSPFPINLWRFGAIVFYKWEAVLNPTF